VRFVRGLFAIFVPISAAGQSVRDQRFFDTKVAPILVKRCLACHNQELNNAGISFEDRETLLKRTPHGTPIVPANPEQSLLVQALQHEGEIQMPPGKKLPAGEIRILTDWVRRGAPWGSKLKKGK
jgi:hypothetical protein